MNRPYGREWRQGVQGASPSGLLLAPCLYVEDVIGNKAFSKAVILNRPTEGS